MLEMSGRGLQFLMKIKELLLKNKLLPLATIYENEDIAGISKALVDADCSALEVTLRDARVRDTLHLFQDHPNLAIGLGTIRSKDDIDLALSSKVAFGITPGLSVSLCEYAKYMNFNLIPGVQSASEIMLASELGYSLLKFFPAEISGGANKLKAIQSVFPDISFIPTGGVNESNFDSYLNLENVICVGSSDLISSKLLSEKDWEGISLNINRIKNNLCK